MNILELGNYVVPAYAGMILAEQGHQVTKWIQPDTDPILTCLHRGEELWDWINHGKALEAKHPREIFSDDARRFEVVLDNFRPSTLRKWGIDPEQLAIERGYRWVSMRSEEIGRASCRERV